VRRSAASRLLFNTPLYVSYSPFSVEPIRPRLASAVLFSPDPPPFVLGLSCVALSNHFVQSHAHAQASHVVHSHFLLAISHLSLLMSFKSIPNPTQPLHCAQALLYYRLMILSRSTHNSHFPVIARVVDARYSQKLSTYHPPFVENQALPLCPQPVACMPTGPVVPLYTLPVFISTFYLRVSKLLDPFCSFISVRFGSCLSSLFSSIPIISSN